MKCSACRFWKPLDDIEVGENRVGECHRYAPKPTHENPITFKYWPPVPANEFCGEFQPKVVEQEIERVPINGHLWNDKGICCLCGEQKKIHNLLMICPKNRTIQETERNK